MYVLTAKIIASTALLASSALAVPISPKAKLGSEISFPPRPVVAAPGQTQVVKGGNNTQDVNHIVNTTGEALPKEPKPKGIKIAPQIFYGPGPVVPAAGTIMNIGGAKPDDVTQAPQAAEARKEMIELANKAIAFSLLVPPSETEGLQVRDHVDGGETDSLGIYVDANADWKDIFEQAAKFVVSPFTPPSEAKDLHVRNHVEDDETDSFDTQAQIEMTDEQSEALVQLYTVLSDLKPPFVAPKVQNHWNGQGAKVNREVAKEGMLIVPDWDFKAWRDYLEKNRDAVCKDGKHPGICS